MKTGPAIDELHDFAGTLLHSANWDTCERYAADGTVPSLRINHIAVDWKDKRVAVIGTGSSAIQMVPQLQKSELTAKCGSTEQH